MRTFAIVLVMATTVAIAADDCEILFERQIAAKDIDRYEILKSALVLEANITGEDLKKEIANIRQAVSSRKNIIKVDLIKDKAGRYSVRTTSLGREKIEIQNTKARADEIRARKYGKDIGEWKFIDEDIALTTEFKILGIVNDYYSLTENYSNPEKERIAVIVEYWGKRDIARHELFRNIWKLKKTWINKNVNGINVSIQETVDVTGRRVLSWITDTNHLVKVLGRDIGNDEITLKYMQLYSSVSNPIVDDFDLHQWLHNEGNMIFKAVEVVPEEKREKMMGIGIRLLQRIAQIPGFEKAFDERDKENDVGEAYLRAKKWWSNSAGRLQFHDGLKHLKVAAVQNDQVNELKIENKQVEIPLPDKPALVAGAIKKLEVEFAAVLEFQKNRSVFKKYEDSKWIFAFSQSVDGPIFTQRITGPNIQETDKKAHPFKAVFSVEHEGFDGTSTIEYYYESASSKWVLLKKF